MDSHPKQMDRILAQWSNENLVLLNLNDGEYYSLNRIGGRVWELCDGTRSVSQVASIICQEYDAPPDTIRADLLDLMAELVNANLVVQDDQPMGGDNEGPHETLPHFDLV